MENAAPSQIEINQAIVMLSEICQRVFHAKEVSAQLRGDEDRASLIALADSLRNSLDVVGMLADSAAQKIGGSEGNFYRDPIEWMMPPIYRSQIGPGQGSAGQIEGA